MTRAELLEATARELHVLAAGQPLAAGPQARLLAKYVSLHGELVTDNLVQWTNTEAIPDKASEPVVAMLAARCVNVFGVSGKRRDSILERGTYPAAAGQAPSWAERALRRSMALPYIHSPQRPDYF